MHEKYLGDSYDFAKRFLGEALSPIARLYAHPDFVPASIRERYTQVTRTPIFPNERPQDRFGVLLDPDTGVALGAATRRHASLSSIIEINSELGPDYIVCYDQSYHRKHDLGHEGQRGIKMMFLRERGLPSFYYVSHAPSLFVARDERILNGLYERLMSEGIPKQRFELSKVTSYS
jgi:hypothetical protein